MRWPCPFALPSTLAAALLSTQLADSASDPARSATVLLRAGDSALDSGRVMKAYARLRGFQREQFGTTPKAQLHGYIEQVAARDLLLSEHGRKSGTLDSDRVHAQYRLILGDALVAALRASLDRATPISDGEVKSYYDAHSELFHRPERIRIMRILVDSEAEATTLLEKVRQLPNMDDWRNLVREKSKDRATAERGGDLGFVAADGTTDVPELEAERSLFLAAQLVKDGEVVRQPVTEGNRFAVVWRRGSLAPKTLELAEEAPKIRVQLADDRVNAELLKLVAKLRQEHLREYHPVLLNDREFRILDSATAPAPASATAPSASSGVATPTSVR